VNLFTANAAQKSPLADRMRPRTLDEFLGQEQIVGPGKLLRRAIQADKLGSCIFYGPPGVGKSTLAQIIANTTGSDFYKLNAVTSGVSDVREIIKKAEDSLSMYGRESFLLLDECHRWSKAQSDSILPAMENGTIKLIGSTTENPMVAMTSAILSRCRLFEFFPISSENIKKAIRTAAADPERGFGNMDLTLEDEAVDHWADVANGDIRCALNALELAVLTTKPDRDGNVAVTLEIAEQSIQKRMVRMDEGEYYDMLSAFCKSLRGSDPDAALFWFARMMYAGVDPRIPVRRMIAHASEDVGLADPNALLQAVAAFHALNANGMPEARLNIAQAIIYICESPKSNSVVMAVDKAFHDAEHAVQTPVPNHLADTHYRGAEQMKKGEGYKYPHDYENHYIPQQYLPDELMGAEYYHPSDEGYEKNIKERRKKLGK
jgi:putative ATPase